MKNIRKVIDKTFRFRGVTNRKPYWTYVIFYAIIRFTTSSAAALYTSYYNKVNNLEPDGFLFSDELFVLHSIIFIPLIAATFRRIRDTGYSPWLSLIPIINLVFASLPSKIQREAFL
jgi:uncharacterized membrane protein YhaH (DUF805 family)